MMALRKVNLLARPAHLGIALLAVGALVLAISCTPTDAELELQRTVTVERDIVYVENEPHDRHVLDLYLPSTELADGPAPVLLWFHGGFWNFGSKNGYSITSFKGFLEDGIAVANVNYRYASQATSPAQVHDAKAAVRFLRANAEQYGLDPDRVAAGGLSSGGYLASMLGLTEGDPYFENLAQGNADQPSTIQAALVMNAPSDFTRESEWQGLLSPLGIDWRQSYWLISNCGNLNLCDERALVDSPIHHVDEDNDTAFFVQHGTLDFVIPLSQATALCDAITASGGECQLNALAAEWHLTPITNAAVEFVSEKLEVS